MRTTPRVVLLALAALTAALGPGCGAPDDPAPADPPSSVDYELFSSTHVLGSDDLAALTDVGADGALRFASTPPSLAGLAVGEVLLTGVSPRTPHGLLRVVLGIDRQASGALVLRTAAAPLQIAFKRLHARVVHASEGLGQGTTFTPTDLSPMALRPAFSVALDAGDKKSFQVLVFDGDSDASTTNDQVRIDTTLGGGIAFTLSLDVDWGAVEKLPETVTECLTSIANLAQGELPACSIDALAPELKLGFVVEPHLEAELAVSGAASIGFSKEFELGTITLAPITVGPLVFLPAVDIVATVDGSASARFSARAHANLRASTSVLLSSKLSNSKVVPFELKEADAGAETPEIDLHAQASARPGVRFSLALYGVLGPYATLAAAARIAANPLESPCWALDVGLETQLGVLVKTPSLPVVGSITFLDWNTGPIVLFSETAASGACVTTPEGAQKPPPGGGPSAQELQSPPFTPWARLVEAPVDGSDLASLHAFATGFPVLAPAVDGRYIAGGGRTRGIVKIDAEGAATWMHQLVTPAGQELRSLGSVPSADAGLVTLFRPGNDSSFILAKDGQSGAPVAAVSFTVDAACGAATPVLGRDAGSGFVVVGECLASPGVFLVHLDASLAVTRSVVLRDADPATIRTTPTALTRSGDQLVVAGNLARQGEPDGDSVFVLRLGDDDGVQAASALACPERLSLYPTAVRPSSAGAITLVGDASGVSYVARLKPDGSPGFVVFPNLGGGVQNGFSANDVIELPATGLVVSSTVSGPDGAPTDLILAGLDAAGHTMWAREYALHGAGGLRAFGWPGAHLTDDGGVFVVASAGPDGASTGALVAMKVFARDGTLPDGPLVTSTPVALEEGTFAVKPKTFAPVTTDIAVTAQPFVPKTP